MSKRFLVYLLVLLAGLGATFGAYKYITAPIQTNELGAGYNPVTGYQSRTTSYISPTAATIPVASTQDPAGNQISLSNISASGTVRVFFNLEPGSSREEAVYCTGVTAISWTGCVRGIPFQGSDISPSTTLQMAHNAGAAIVMRNVSQFYNNFVSTDGGDQTIWGAKTFGVLPAVTSTTAVPTTNNQLVTWYAAPTLVAGGFSSLNVSSTLGLQAITSGVPNCASSATCVGVNASTTGGIIFASVTGSLVVSVSSTASDTLGGYLKHVFGAVNQSPIYWDAPTFLSLAHTWGAYQTLAFGASVPVQPTSSIDQVSLQAEQQGFSTGTAAVPITAGHALYITTIPSIAEASANATSTAYPFIGFALNTTTTGAIVYYSRQGGIANSGLSGLTAGSYYYLSNTTGSIALTPGTVPVRSALALSTTSLQTLRAGFRAVTSGTIFINTCSANQASINPGWQPNSADFICASTLSSLNSLDPTVAPSSTSRMVTNSDGSTSFYGGAVGFTANRACVYRNYIYTVSTTQVGLNVTCTGATGVAASPIYYTFYHDEQ